MGTEARCMPPSELRLVAVLAGIQLTGILDMLMVPAAGSHLMRALAIGPAELGLMMLLNTASSCVCAIAFAPLADRFNRRTVQLLLYAGFGVGLATCALAPPDFGIMLVARIFTGCFAALMSATSNVMLGDAVPPARRGLASGIISSAYGVAFVIGIPGGLTLAHLLSWRVVFGLTAALSVVVGAAGLAVIPSLPRGEARAAGPRLAAGALARLQSIMAVPVHRTALAFNALQMFSVYLVTAYLASFLV